MATRKPLILLSGVSAELPPGDTVVGAQAGILTAGSGLTGGGDLSTNQRIDVSLAAAPSGLIFVGNQLGIDGSAQASGNAALSSAATAQASGNAALSRAGGTMTGQIIFAAGQQINSSVNLSGGISGGVPYQSAPNATTFLNPGISGQVLATQGNNQFPTWITPGGGKILQVTQTVDQGSYWSTTSTTYVSTSLSVSITPSSTSSRILILATLSNMSPSYSDTLYFTLFRNSTNLATGASASFAYPPGAYSPESTALTFLDSPSTTSSVTYAVYARTGAGNIGYLGNSGNTSTIQVLEVGP